MFVNCYMDLEYFFGIKTYKYVLQIQQCGTKIHSDVKVNIPVSKFIMTI